MQPVRPRKSNSTQENPGFDRYLYRLSHLVENAFARLNILEALRHDFTRLHEITK